MTLTSIDLDDVLALGNVDDALADFYSQQIANAAANTGVREREIRAWVEDELIGEQGFRSQVLHGPGEDGPSVLRELENAHLIRADARRGAQWYELAHDRLVEPVRVANAAWRAENLSPLQVKANEWERRSRPPGLLITGDVLDEMTEWAEANPDELAAADGDYLDACRANERAALAVRRNARRFRLLAAALAILLVGAIVVGFVAASERNRAEERARSAEAARVAKLSDLTLSQDVAVAALLAVESWHVEPSELAEGTLLTAVQRFGDAQGLIPIVSDGFGFDTGPDGLVAISSDGEVVLWDLDEEQVIGTIPTEGSVELLLSPDGKVLASSGYRLFGTEFISFWDLESSELLSEVTPPEEFIGLSLRSQLAFLPDGKSVAFASSEESIVWDIETGETIGSLPPGGAMLVAREGDIGAVSDGLTVSIWDPVTFDVIERLQLPPPPDEIPDFELFFFSSLAQGPDRELIAGGFDAPTAWDLDTRMQLDFEIDRFFSSELETSVDGSKLAADSVIWDVATQEPIAVFDVGGDTGFLIDGRFTADGSSLLLPRFDATGRATPFLQVFPTESSPETGLPVGPLGGTPIEAVFRSDGLISVLVDATPYDDFEDMGPGSLTHFASAVVDPDRLEIVTNFEIGEGDSALISRDGSTASVVRTTGDDAVLIVTEAATGTNLMTVDIESGPISFALSHDGRFGALADEPGEVRLIDVATGATLAALRNEGFSQPALAFDAQDRLTVVQPSPEDGTWHVSFWTSEGAQLREPVEIAVDAGAQSAFVTDDGRFLVVTARDGAFVLELESPDRAIRLTAAGQPPGRIASAGASRVLIPVEFGLQMWDLASLQPIGENLSGSGFGRTVVVREDGVRRESIGLVAPGDVLFVTRRPLHPEALVDRACDLADRNLTDEEWRRFFPDQEYRETCSG